MFDPRSRPELPGDPHEEEGIADKIPARETLRLLGQAIDPFKAPSLHPRRRARDVARKKIEQGPDAYAEGAARRSQVLLDEELLSGIAHRHQQDIGLGPANEINDFGNRVVIEVAVVTPNKCMLRAQ